STSSGRADPTGSAASRPEITAPRAIARTAPTARRERPLRSAGAMAVLQAEHDLARPDQAELLPGGALERGRIVGEGRQLASQPLVLDAQRGVSRAQRREILLERAGAPPALGIEH